MHLAYIQYKNKWGYQIYLTEVHTYACKTGYSTSQLVIRTFYISGHGDQEDPGQVGGHHLSAPAQIQLR